MIKRFNIKDINVFIRGDQEKGTYTEVDSDGNEKTYYIKSENTIYDKNPISKIHLKKIKDPHNNMILHECITSKIFQKLGINAVSYHFGRIIDPQNNKVWIPAVYSESYVKEGESQFSLDDFFVYDYLCGKKGKIISPDRLLSGKKIPIVDECDFSNITYVDENLYFIKNFIESIKDEYPGGIVIDYEKMKTDMIMEVIGDLLCHNRDRNPLNITFVSKLDTLSKDKNCSIRLAPAYDFGLSFFSRQDSKYFYDQIITKGVPHIMADCDTRFFSLTDGAQKDIFDEFDMVQDYLLLIKDKKNLTPGEAKTKKLISKLINLNIRDCFKELFVEELDGAKESMSMDELIGLYNTQMKKDIDIYSIINIEKLFNASRYILLHQNPLRRRCFKSCFIDEKPFAKIPPLVDLSQKPITEKETISEELINTNHSAMGDDE